MKSSTTISPIETVARLRQAGFPTTTSSVRRWCLQGFGIRLMGRWRIPEQRVAELERKLRDAGDCSEGPTCRASKAKIEKRRVGRRGTEGSHR